jgi:hypothetical protein
MNDSTPIPFGKTQENYHTGDKMFKMNRILAPTGCSRTSKPLVDNIEQEIAETLKRNSLFEIEIQKEYQKLNFPLEYYLKAYKPPKKIKRIRALTAISIEKHKPKKEMTAETKAPKKNSNISTRSSATDPIISSIKKSDPKLPLLTKSIPIHLDPKFKLPRKKKVVIENPNERLSSVNSIIKTCKYGTSPDIKNLEIEILSFRQETSDINYYLDDLVDSIKYSRNEEKIENMMSTRVYNRKLDKKLKEESVVIQKQLLETTKNLMRIGEYKLKRNRRSL